MKNSYKIAAIATFGLFFFINIFTLNDGHNWGDDFAQYIQNAINLIEHKPYSSGISYDLWVIYPPGFPFLLSSVIYWFGINFKVLKFLNVLLWALSAMAAYGLALRRLGPWLAGLIMVWFLTLPFFFFFKQNVLSDIPFMCFVLLSIWTFIKSEEYHFNGKNDSSGVFLWVSIFCMSYSLLIRWAGISLFLAVGLYFIVIKHEWKRSLGFMLGAVLSWFIAFQCGSSVGGYFDRTTVFLLREWLLVGWYNLTNTFQTMLGFYILDGRALSAMINAHSFLYVNTCLGLLLCGGIGTFCYLLYKRKVGFLGCYTALYSMGIVCWPVHAGPRFLLPILVPVTIYAVQWMTKASRKMAMFVLLILILQNVFVIYSNFNFNDDDIYQKSALEMMQWVGLHIKPDENYMFSKPRALGILTHRYGHTFGSHQTDMKDWYKSIGPLHINYLIADKRFDQFSRYNNFHLHVNNYELYINKVWENNLYKIFNVVLPDKTGPITTSIVR